MPSWNDTEKTKIANLIKTAKITKDVSWYRKDSVKKIVAAKATYQKIEDATGVPKVMVAIIQAQEDFSDLGVFKSYLGNGQPFNKKTTIVPKGRGPFSSWEAGAIDAIKYDKLDQVKGWSLEKVLFYCEFFNGFGYRSHGINTPYVWCFTNHYTKGRYVAD